MKLGQTITHKGKHYTVIMSAHDAILVIDENDNMKTILRSEL